MQCGGDDVSVRAKMEETRLICEREIPIQQQRMETAAVSFRKSLVSIKEEAEQTLQIQEKLRKLKAELREVEDLLVKALAAKTRKEAKQMAMLDSISATQARIEELKKIVDDQTARKDDYEAIISQLSEALKACKEKHAANIQHREEIEEAISWYNKFLGFRIESGHGVKFIFTNINSEKPEEQYSFTIRHENDVYTLLDCDPHLNDTKELIAELNKSNGLFKFVRIMRGKFQDAAAHRIFQVMYQDQDTSTISLSAPASSASNDSRNESSVKAKEFLPAQYDKHSWIANHGKENKPSLSPGSALSLRRSPRLKVMKRQ